MENVLLLAKGGRLAYYGATKQIAGYFSRHCSQPIAAGQNPADYVIDVLDSAKLCGKEP